MIRFEDVLALTTTCRPTELPNRDITKIVMYATVNPALVSVVNPNLISVECKGTNMTLFKGVLV